MGIIEERAHFFFFLPKGDILMALESKFQKDLKAELAELFPGCIVLKNDANSLQGFPDLTILYKDKWAVLESKRALASHRQPNQQYYVDMLSAMSFAAFIHPGNKEQVLHELQQTFESRR
jgi:hypothetical protein